MKLTMKQRVVALFTGRVDKAATLLSSDTTRLALPPGSDDARYIGDDAAVHAAIARQANTTIGEWSEHKAVKIGLKASTWVFACISRIASNAAGVPWHVERQVSDDEWEPIVGVHPLSQLFSKPNKIYSRLDLIERLVFHLYLTGNSLMHKTRGASGRVEELWVIPPDNIKPIKDPVEVVTEYKISSPPQAVPFDDIMHLMFTDPADPTWGLGPLQVVARAVSSDTKAQAWQEASMDNRATPDGVLSVHRPMSEEQYANTIAGLNSKSGQARKALVLSGTEATWQQLSMSPIEMDFLESRKLTREEICAVFNVPPPLIGIYENATLANIETSRVIFWQETIIPLMERLAEGFNRVLAPEFGEGIRVVPDYSQVPALRDMLKSSTTSAQILFAMGVPFNEINRRLALGFDAIEGGDVGLVGAGMVPVTALGGNDLGGIGSFGGSAFGSFGGSSVGFEGLTFRQASTGPRTKQALNDALMEVMQLESEADIESNADKAFKLAYLKEKLRLAGVIDD